MHASLCTCGEPESPTETELRLSSPTSKESIRVNVHYYLNGKERGLCRACLIHLLRDIVPVKLKEFEPHEA